MRGIFVRRNGMQLGLRTAFVAVAVSLFAARSVCVAQAPAAPGSPFDAAPFATAIHDGEGKWHGLRWAEPRKIRAVVVQFPMDAPLPDPSSVRIEYWHRTWDGQPEPVIQERAAGRMGWDAIDDWTNGKWKKAEIAGLDGSGSTFYFRFAPTGKIEFEKLAGPGVTYRRTLQIRVAADQPLPKPVLFQTFTDAVYRPMAARVHFGKPADKSVKVGDDDVVAVEAYNGIIAGPQKIEPGPTTLSDVEAAIYAGGHEIRFLMAVDPFDSRYDRTIITLRSKYRPFSFAADEIARGDRVLVDDLGVLVARGDDGITLDAYREARAEFPGRTVYDRVFDEPEQTLSHAWDDMPLKRPLYFVHGLPGDRNLMHQQADGTIEVAGKGHWFVIDKSPRDCERKLWDAKVLTLSFGFPAETLRGGRELRDGYLPELRTWWQDGCVYYELVTVLDKIDGDLSRVTLDDPTALRARIRVVNTSRSETGTARLRLSEPGGESEALYAKGDCILADYQGAPRVRLLFDAKGGGTLRPDGRTVAWSMELKPGQAHELYAAVPSVTLNEDEVAPLRTQGFDAASRRVCDFWRAQAQRGAAITTPEPWLNDFYKAHALHLLINCYQELHSDRLHAHVGSFWYGVYPNESVMMISDLDRRGYHDEARRNLESFLHYQGTVAFLGNYRSKEGLFYGAGGHETGNYNKSHGYVMWNMGEHWWNTRDRDWMAAAAPKLVAACDWVTRERQATMKTNEDGSRPIEYGFLPAGSLEDVTDFWHWLATNAATAWGFRNLADALADFGHPEAARLQKEAKAYTDDLMAGWTEARIRAPVVRLRDATYVPKFPSRLYERGRSHGWLRETLEGSMFLPAYRLLPPERMETGWILKDYEDNLYISEAYGYSIPAFDRFWFSRGGFSMQAQLLDGPLPYLYRDEIKHYLRAYFNGFASAFYPEIRMCNEHSLPELGYPAGDHFKTSDEAQSTYWLRLMFVCELGDELHLGRAIPRYWLAQGNTIGIERSPSYFGPLSWRMTSNVKAGEIRASVTPPTRNRPKTITVRFRHPDAKPMQSVTVNGKPYDRFDPKKEWVVLDGGVEGPVEIVVKYGP